MASEASAPTRQRRKAEPPAESPQAPEPQPQGGPHIQVAKTGTGTLVERLARIQAQMDRIAHDTNVSAGGESYSATSINAIADAARPLLAAEGVVIIPRAVVVERHDEVTSRRGAKGYHIVLRQAWTIAAGGDSMEAETTGASLDYSDKGYNKAHTFARKNLLMSLLNLSTGENPDAEQPEAGHREPYRAPAPPPPPPPAAAPQLPEWQKRQRNLEQRGAQDDITADEVELAVREACGDSFGYPRGLADDAHYATAQEALRALLVARGAITPPPAAE